MPKLRRRFEKAKAYLEDIKQEAKAYPVVNSFPAMTNFLDNAELISFCFAHSNFEALFRTEEFYRGEFITTLLRMLSASKSLASPNEPPRGVVEFLRGESGLVLLFYMRLCLYHLRQSFQGQMGT